MKINVLFPDDVVNEIVVMPKYLFDKLITTSDFKGTVPLRHYSNHSISPKDENELPDTMQKRVNMFKGLSKEDRAMYLEALSDRYSFEDILVNEALKITCLEWIL